MTMEKIVKWIQDFNKKTSPDYESPVCCTLTNLNENFEAWNVRDDTRFDILIDQIFHLNWNKKLLKNEISYLTFKKTKLFPK